MKKKWVRWAGLALVALVVVLLSGPIVSAIADKFSDNIWLFDDKYFGWGGDASTAPDFRSLYDEAGDDRLELTDAAANIMGYVVDNGTTGSLTMTGSIESTGFALGDDEYIEFGDAAPDIRNGFSSANGRLEWDDGTNVLMALTDAGASGQLFVTGSSFILGSGSGNMSMDFNGGAGAFRDFAYQSAGVDRWIWRVDNVAESGGNAGSDFIISARNDAGGLISNAFKITRSTALVTVDRDLAVNGGDFISDDATFALLNVTPTTINAFQAATSIVVGGPAVVFTLGNNSANDPSMVFDGATTDGTILYDEDFLGVGQFRIDSAVNVSQGSITAGADDVTEGTLEAYGDNGTTSGRLVLQAGATDDVTAEYWDLKSFNGTTLFLGTDESVQAFWFSTTAGESQFRIGNATDDDPSIVLSGNTTTGTLNYDEDNGELEWDQHLTIAKDDLTVNLGGGATNGPSLVFDTDTNDTTISQTNTENQLLIGRSVRVGGSGGLFLKESAAAEVDIATWGQFWVKTVTPNEAWFTNDAGEDIPLGAAADAFSTLTRTEGTANGWAVTSTLDTWEKIDLNNANAAVGHEDDNLNAVGSKANSWITIGALGAGIYDATLGVGAKGVGVNKSYWYGIAITLATPIDIASITNATPPVVTTTSPHGFHEGSITGGGLGVIIAGTTGAGAAVANGSHWVTIVDADEFSLQDFTGTDVAGLGGAIDNNTGDVTVEVHGETLKPRLYANASDWGNVTSFGDMDLAASDTVHGVIGGVDDGTDVTAASITLTIHRH